MGHLQQKSISIIKIGGGVITDKNKPFSLRESILDSFIKDISRYEKPLIIVHGGGSFGHPVADTYKIQDGKNENVKDQEIGFSKTHNAMLKLNQIILDKLISYDIPAFSFQPSSCFYMGNENEIEVMNEKLLLQCLENNLTPIFYGDVIFSKNKEFQIISGDKIIFELSKMLHKYIDKIIFAIEVDGIYGYIEKENVMQKSDENMTHSSELMRIISFNDLERLQLANLGNKIDVTGGIRNKIDNIRKIAQLGLDTYVINGIKENNLYKCLISDDSSIYTLIQGKKQ